MPTARVVFSISRRPFCAFGARRLVSRGEFSWFVSSFVAHVATDAAPSKRAPLAPPSALSAGATVVRETTLNVESFAQNALEAIACGCIVVAGAVHARSSGTWTRRMCFLLSSRARRVGSCVLEGAARSPRVENDDDDEDGCGGRHTHRARVRVDVRARERTG